jgi:hypothetical protein
VAPDQTLKAIAIKPGLSPSRVLACTCRKVSVAAPVIEPVGPSFETKVGEPFKLQMKASEDGVEWGIWALRTAFDRERKALARLAV